VGFVVDKATLVQVFPAYLGFSCKSFHQLLYTHYHPSSGAGEIGQIVADIHSGLSHIPSQEPKKNKDPGATKYWESDACQMIDKLSLWRKAL
jgi:hypothetical protein